MKLLIVNLLKSNFTDDEMSIILSGLINSSNAHPTEKIILEIAKKRFSVLVNPRFTRFLNHNSIGTQLKNYISIIPKILLIVNISLPKITTKIIVTIGTALVNTVVFVIVSRFAEYE